MDAGSSVREPLVELPGAAFDPVVQQLAVGTHGPDCRPGELNRPSVGRKAEHAVVTAANAPARSDVTPIGILKALDRLALEIEDLRQELA